MYDVNDIKKNILLQENNSNLSPGKEI